MYYYQYNSEIASSILKADNAVFKANWENIQKYKTNISNKQISGSWWSNVLLFLVWNIRVRSTKTVNWTPQITFAERILMQSTFWTFNISELNPSNACGNLYVMRPCFIRKMVCLMLYNKKIRFDFATCFLLAHDVHATLRGVMNTRNCR